MKIAIALFMCLFSIFTYAGETSGEISVSLTIMPSRNDCSIVSGGDTACSINTESLVKEMGSKKYLSSKNYIVSRDDKVLSVSY